MGNWTQNDIPDLNGKIAIVTGANSGLGFYTTKYLARNNAEVVMACRSEERATDAMDQLKSEGIQNINFLKLDLASLESIKLFSEQFRKHYNKLDILVNNAGLMAIPHRTTEEGFEMQFGVNHLGHFTLTGLLFDIITENSGRVVNVSSSYHKRGKINFDDPHFKNRKYKKWEAYSQSKLANIYFTKKLQELFERLGTNAISVAAHPGYASTNLQFQGPEMEGSGFKKFMMRIANFLFAQSAEMGALPQTYAATAENVEGGQYYGPGGFIEIRGYPEKVEVAKQANDNDIRDKLWEYSEEVTGINYNNQISQEIDLVD